MTETWKTVPGFELLEASNMGRIRKKPYMVKLPNGGFRGSGGTGTFGAVYKANKIAKHSYRGVTYRCYGPLKVHRLVCLAFYGLPPFERAVVIHIDEDAHNNKPENLKWGTQKENMNTPKFKEWQRTRTGENNPYIKGRLRKQMEQS